MNFMAVVDETRINLGELKSRIVKRVGPDRSRLYFSYLNRLLAQKLTKLEFNKLCLSILGQENVPLHNELIQSILKNAYSAKAPPPFSSKPVKYGSRHAKIGPPPPPIWSNGDLFPTSPRKSRSAGGRDRRYKDRSRLLGPNGVIVKENGVLGHCDLKRSVQKHKDTCEDKLDKRPRMGCSLGIEIVEEGEEVVEQCSDFELCSRRNPIQVPIGIQRPLTLASSRDSINTSLSTGELCHSEDLMKRMEGIVRARGLEGVSVDCANLLNNGLDTYLKQLIRSCFQLVVSRSEQESIKNPIFQQPNKKAVNGVWQGNNMHVLSSDGFLNRRMEHTSHSIVSLQHFRVAMEMNPMQLGENWPLLLEKICLRSFEK